MLTLLMSMLVVGSALSQSIDYQVAGNVIVDADNIQKALPGPTFNTGSNFTNGTMRTIVGNTTVSTGGWKFIPPTVTIRAADPSVSSFNYTWCAGYFGNSDALNFNNVKNLNTTYRLVLLRLRPDSDMCNSALSPLNISSNATTVNSVVGPTSQQIVGANSSSPGAITTEFSFQQAFLPTTVSTNEIYFMVVVIRTTVPLSVVFTRNLQVADSNAFIDYIYTSPPSPPAPPPFPFPPPRPSPPKPPNPPKAADRLSISALSLVASTLIAALLLAFV